MENLILIQRCHVNLCTKYTIGLLFWVTVVYVQITLLWRYFTLEITLGSKKNYTVFSAITNCQTQFDINIEPRWYEMEAIFVFITTSCLNK